MDTRTTLPGPSGASHPAGTVANALTVAGSDPSGGAGVQADLKTFAAFGVYGTAVVTALTAQNTRGVDGVLPTPSEFVAAQLDSLLTDVRIDAVKVGMLGQGAVARVVADALRGALAGVPTVLDPVMVATSGDSLAADDVQTAITQLLPHVTVVTPNLPEAAALSGLPHAVDEDGMRAQAEAILALGAGAVLIKGGHLDTEWVVDLLVDASGVRRLEGRRVATRNTHGTGCTLSSAIAAGLAQGLALPAACARARAWLTGALQRSDALSVGDGSGHGPVNHFAPLPDGRV